MATTETQHAIDIICGTTGTAGAGACVLLLDILPITLQLLSAVSLTLSIAWFFYRFWMAWKGRKK